MSYPFRLARTCTPAVLLLLVITASASAAPSADQIFADQIFSDTGIRGGLIVHLGCGDGTLTAELRSSDAFLVHGLDRDPANVKRARSAIAARKLYGPVSVDRLIGNRLPYAENMVNLVVAEDSHGVPLAEIRRVLAPHGVAYVQGQDGWKKSVKPWPVAMDEWTHFLHGPDGNAVGHDELVGPPQHLRWMGSPKFARAHEQQASFSTCVTSAGRMFYIVDEAPRVDIRMPAQWKLVARDAFNGVVLWKRDLGKWVDQFRRFRAGPASLQFRIVASPQHVFVTLDFEGPVSVLDAVTGETQNVIAGSEHTKQIIHRDGMLTLLTDEQVGEVGKIDAARLRGQFIPHNCRILKAKVDSGSMLWRYETDELVFPCVAYKNGRLYAQTTKRVFALDDETGEVLWSNELAVDLNVAAGKLRSGEMQWEAPTLLVGDKAVYAADFKKLHAYSVEGGRLLWDGSSAKGYNAPPDLYLIGGLLWTSQKGKRVGLDPLTGELKKELPHHGGYMHARCYRNKATDRYIMLGLMGVQMVDITNGEVWDNDWIRGTCQYGILPANGLLYVPPDSCGCNMKTKLSGIYALASSRPGPPATAKSPRPAATAHERLERGPAYNQIRNQKSEITNSKDWLTYRGTPAHNGLTKARVPTQLKTAWTTDLGGKLSAVTVADGRVYVAAVDRHTLYALNQDDGHVIWQFTAGGRIDSPPTIHRGAAYFGSADGHLYAVRASDGELIWRFRGAPDDTRVFVQGQLESVWPVHGSVLLHEGALVLTAGRSSYLDGGIHLYRLNPASGEVLSGTAIYSPDAEGKQPTGGGKDVFGALSDVLLADGKDIYMRHAKLDFDAGATTETGVHLFSPIGMLDDSWWHRAYWLMNDQFVSHWSGWWKAGNQTPSGRILSYDDNSIYGFGRTSYPGGNTGQWRGGERYHLFAFDRMGTKKPQPDERPAAKPRGKKPIPKRQPKTPPLQYRWTSDIPLLGTALVVAGDAVFVAGPPDVIETAGQQGHEALLLKNPEEAVDAWQGRQGGILFAASVTDGNKLAQHKLPAPTVFDGMAAVDGSLFLALKDGSVVGMTASK